MEKRFCLTENRCAPNGIRTRVTDVRGQRPRPLDDGSEKTLSLYPALPFDSIKNYFLGASFSFWLPYLLFWKILL